jgi:alkylhydroperoxidase family enzyme
MRYRIASLVRCARRRSNRCRQFEKRQRGVSLEKVEAVETWRQSTLFDRRERAVLDYVEAATRSDLRVNDDQVKRLRSYFDDDGIVELTGLIAFQNMSSKFNSALGAPAQGFCKMPSAEAPG